VHGDLGQGQRALRSGKVDVLTATEVAARGLDVDDVTHVVNYECPDDDMTYVHRIGRTGRAGRAGVAVTFVDWRDMHRWKLINDALNLGKPEPEETYSTSEHLYTQLDIPREATGTLPRAMRGRVGLEAEALEDIGETGKIRTAKPGRGSTAQGGGSGRSGSGRSGSGRSGSGRSGSGPTGAGRGSGRDGSGRNGDGQARGGSGQARKTSGTAPREAGEGGAQAAAGTARARRRRRTRAGRDLGGQENQSQENQPQETRRKAS
jgi:superfamily II DNA/RNA helicase